MNWLVFALVLPGLLMTASADATTSGPGPSVAVTTAKPAHRTFDADISGFGQLEVDPQAVVRLTLPQAGLVTLLDVTAGESIRKGRALLRLTSDPTARLAYQQALTAVKQAKTQLQQVQDLRHRNLATATQLASAQKALGDARSALVAQKALGGDVSTVTLRAPASGVIQSVSVRAGERVSAGAALLELAPDQHMVARIGIDPSKASALHPGQSATLVSVFGGDSISATVYRIAGEINPKTHLLDVLLALSRKTTLPLSTAVNAQIETGHESAWAVPRGAVLQDSHGAYLFQVSSGTAHRINVKVVHAEGDSVGVDGALNPDQPVVVLGAYELQDGMAVREK